jgi:hypothetical protein
VTSSVQSGMTDDALIEALRKQVAAWFSNVHLLEFEELVRRYKKAKEQDHGRHPAA